MDRLIYPIAKKNNKYAEYITLKRQLELFQMSAMNSDPDLEKQLNDLKVGFQTHFPKNKKQYNFILKECKMLIKTVRIKNKF